MTLKFFLKEVTPPFLFNAAKKTITYLHFLRYKDLALKNAELKDIYRGKRCFILGSGPSIKKENLKPLKNEIVFALNNFYVHEDFAEIMSGDVPKYYLTPPVHSPQSEETWRDFFVDLEAHMPKNVRMILGLSRNRSNINNIFDKYDLFRSHNIYWYYVGIDSFSGYKFKERDIQLTNITCNAQTASTYAMYAALYMGFQEIYLVGIDCNPLPVLQKQSYRFYDSAIHQAEESLEINSQFFLNLYHIFFENERIAKHYQNIILNTSQETALDIFEKKTLNVVLSSGIQS